MLSQKTKTLLTKLTQKKYRKQFGAYVVEGIKGVEEALEYGEVLMVIVEGSRRDDVLFGTIVNKATSEDILVEFAGHKDIPHIKTTESFPGIMAVVATQETEYEDLLEHDTIVLLDRINDPGNLGTIIRTADWFGINAILLSEGSVDPYNEKVVRSTMGAMFRSTIHTATNIVQTIDFLKKHGYSIAILDLKGTDLRSAKPQKKTVYVFGSESHGVHADIRSLADSMYTIPGTGGGESLNIAMSVGITLYQISQ